MSVQSLTSSALSALFRLRIVQITVILAAAIAIYSEGATAYLNTQKAIEAKAVADNAALLKTSEGELAEQKARSELEAARNAAVRQKAEADNAEAEADKIEQEAITADNTARNAQLKANADANTIKAEAELRNQKITVALETARNASLRQKAETDKLEAELVTKRKANAYLQHFIEVTDCTKRYRGNGDIAEMMIRRLQCN